MHESTSRQAVWLYLWHRTHTKLKKSHLYTVYSAAEGSRVVKKHHPCHLPVHSLPQNTREQFIGPSCTNQRNQCKAHVEGTGHIQTLMLSELVLVTCIPPLLVARCHLLPRGHACEEQLSQEQAAASPFPLWRCRAQPEEPLQSPLRQQGVMLTQKLARSEMLKRS